MRGWALGETQGWPATRERRLRWDCAGRTPLSPHPPASSSPSSFSIFLLLVFLPLPPTPQQLPPGKGSGAEGSAAASAGCFENLFNWAAEAAARLQRFPLHFCRSSNLKSQDSLFSQPPCPSLTSFPSGPRLPGPKPSLPLWPVPLLLLINPTARCPLVLLLLFFFFCYHSGVSLCPPLLLAVSPLACLATLELPICCLSFNHICHLKAAP